MSPFIRIKVNKYHIFPYRDGSVVSFSSETPFKYCCLADPNHRQASRAARWGLGKIGCTYIGWEPLFIGLDVPYLCTQVLFLLFLQG